jgi:hypothetical protein
MEASTRLLCPSACVCACVCAWGSTRRTDQRGVKPMPSEVRAVSSEGGPVRIFPRRAHKTWTHGGLEMPAPRPGRWHQDAGPCSKAARCVVLVAAISRGCRRSPLAAATTAAAVVCVSKPAAMCVRSLGRTLAPGWPGGIPLPPPTGQATMTRGLEGGHWILDSRPPGRPGQPVSCDSSTHIQPGRPPYSLQCLLGRRAQGLGGHLTGISMAKRGASNAAGPGCCWLAGLLAAGGRASRTTSDGCSVIS